MKPEITPAALLLVALVVALLFSDFTERKKNRRMLAVELVVFTGGAGLILFPEVATRLAHAVGIGRGVDFVIYPLVIWLVRESLLTRRRRREDEERFTELVRALAAERARAIEGVPGGRQGDGSVTSEGLQSAGVDAS